MPTLKSPLLPATAWPKSSRAIDDAGLPPILSSLLPAAASHVHHAALGVALTHKLLPMRVGDTDLVKSYGPSPPLPFAYPVLTRRPH